jgi:hypothetical protein
LSESISIGSEDALLRFILKLGPGYRDLLRHIQIAFLSEDGLSLLEEHFEIPPESLWQCAAEWIARPRPPPPLLDSQIISEFPDIFAEFKGKHSELLWRGSRDGFRAQKFHRLCDGHANTLTVILDTKGNIFGGFTPVEWESRTPRRSWDDSNCWKWDDSLNSFLFTLKNPHNVPARRFALKNEKAGGQSGAMQNGVRPLVTFLFPITATQIQTMPLPLDILTTTILEWTKRRFSRVRRHSKSRKLKYLRLQTKQHFTKIMLACASESRCLTFFGR